ncbi:TetR/AcrR family transcriptional regulator [Streptomyces sp. ADI96-02]|uniref:TetR/AcrR family transcriptional regulator n=1 Tax=Streptomyces sp. ADI96-02 TaxID=1522760 RepID=UPI000F54E150|nr:TetR/AcrR family transcriptional regulator [Streptomyces sp. ADI96-02]
MSAEPPVPRPGGRSARVRAAVHQAVIELLSEPGAGELTLPAVAARAGVNPSSVYRRWGSKEALLADVAVTLLESTWPLPDTGSLRGDLTEWITPAFADFASPSSQLILRALLMSTTDVAEIGAERRTHLERRGREIDQMLARAAARGEPSFNREQVLDLILGPLYMRALFGSVPSSPSYVTGLVDRLFDRRPAQAPDSASTADSESGS